MFFSLIYTIFTITITHQKILAFNTFSIWFNKSSFWILGRINSLNLFFNFWLICISRSPFIVLFLIPKNVDLYGIHIFKNKSVNWLKIFQISRNHASMLGASKRTTTKIIRDRRQIRASAEPRGTWPSDVLR